MGLYIEIISLNCVSVSSLLCLPCQEYLWLQLLVVVSLHLSDQAILHRAGLNVPTVWGDG